MTSVLFTDLVDSTALASRLGPDGAEQLRQTHFGLLRDVIDATGGNEVKNLGDGLMVTFSSPSRALACATGMQQAIERHNLRAPDALGVRIGLSAGEAVEDDGDYFGDTVVEAARLCAAASGGQIFTTAIVHAMVGRHAPQRFAPVGPLELRGLPEPVATVEVLWEPMVTEARVPLPGALVAATSEALFGFFGRAEEVEQLGDMQKRAFTEPRLHTMLVGGEAGIGKTALIAHAARHAHGAGAIVLLGHCDEDLTVPYQPWIEALSHLVQHLGPDCLDTLSPLHRSTLARLVPALGGADWSGGTNLDSERLVLMHAVEMLLTATAAETPVIVVLDDLHWADAASLQVLRYLVSSARAMSVLLLCTYRHTDLGQQHPLTALLADLHRQPNVGRLRLAGLDDAEIVGLIAAAAGHELDDSGVALAHALHRETDGNPFFTGELLRHLGESGVFQQRGDGRWALEEDFDWRTLPASVRDVVARRVARLGTEAARILAIAAVIGREFTLEIVARVAECTEDEALDVLDAATMAALVSEREEPTGSFRFNHALIQRTLYQDLAATRRVRTHQRVAEAIEATTSDEPTRTAELARHWVAATRPADVDKALHYVVQAADEALAALAPDDAIAWYRQALDLLARQVHPDRALRARLLIGLGAAQRHIGVADRDTLLEAIALAEEIDDPALLVAAILAADRGVAGTSGTDVEWVAATEAALEAIGRADSTARARLLAALSQVIDAREWARRRDLVTEAVEVARRIDDGPTLLMILPVAYQHYGPEALDRRLAETAEAIARAERSGDVLAGCNALFHRIDACMQNVDIDEVDQRIAELTALAESTRLPFNLWQLHMVTSCRALVDGRCADAETEATTALEIGSAGGQAEAMLAYGTQLLEIRRHEGRLDEMASFLAQIPEAEAASAGVRQLLAGVYADLGDEQHARALLALDVATAFAEVPADESWMMAMSCCATAAVMLHDRDASSMLYDKLLAFEGRVVSVYTIVTGGIARHLGRLAAELGRYDDADRHFAVALDLHERIRAPYWIASTLLDLRDMLTRRGAPGDHARADESLTRAREIARAHGFAGLLRR